MNANRTWAIYFFIAMAAYVLLIILMGPASPAEFKWTEDDRELSITGEIEANDANRMMEVVGPIQLDAPIQIRLNSPGGSILEANTIALMFQKIEETGVVVATSVGFGEMCASACISIYAIGQQRFMSGKSPGLLDGHLAVHTVALNGEETATTDLITVNWVRSLKELGVPSSVLAKLITTSSRRATMLDEKDYADWGIQWVRLINGKASIIPARR